MVKEIHSQRPAGLGQQPTFYLNFLDRRLYDALQSFDHVPGDRLRTASSGHSDLRVLSVNWVVILVE